MQDSKVPMVFFHMEVAIFTFRLAQLVLFDF